MKNRIALVLCLIFLLALSGCGSHEHTWIEASCTEARTCSECGETEGEPLGHDWTEFPTVDAPISCTHCGKTKGDAVTFYCPVEMLKTGDGYTLVTFDEDCNELSRISDISSCYLDESSDGTISIIAYVQNGDQFFFILYDLNGEELSRLEESYDALLTPVSNDGSKQIFAFGFTEYSCFLVCYDLSAKEIFRMDDLLYAYIVPEQNVLIALREDKGLCIPAVYDFDGTLTYEFSPSKGCKVITDNRLTARHGTLIAQAFNENQMNKVVVSDIHGNRISETSADALAGWSVALERDCFMLSSGNDKGDYEVRLHDYSGAWLHTASVTVSPSGCPTMSEADEQGVARIFDDETDKTLFYVDVYSGQEVPARQAENGNYVSNAWGYYQSVPDSDRSFVGSVDRTRWGFLDKDGKELATYADASNFNRYGYALASNDGENYFLIDKDFHIISEELPGISGAVNSYFFNLYLEDEKGNIKLFIVR